MSAPTAALRARRSAFQDLDLVLFQAKFELRSFLRNRQARFFTIILPVVFLVIFVSVFGNHTLRLASGAHIKTSTYYIPALTTMGIIGASFTNLVVSVVDQRESGILKRRRSTPVPAHVLILGKALLSIALGLVMCALLMAIGSLAYGATVPTHTLPGVVVSAVLGSLTFCVLGYALSTFVSDEDAAQPVVQLTLLPLYFISGVFVPVTEIPAWLSNIAAIFPVKHLAAALLKAYDPTTTGAGFSGPDLGVMALWTAGGLIVALRRFSWYPKGK